MIRQKTMVIRHFFVKLVAPKLYITYKNLPPYKSYPRPMIKFCQTFFSGKPVIGLEIGVATGRNAESMAKTLNVKMLYLVDPYETYYDHENYITTYHKMKDDARKLVDRTVQNYRFIYKKSEDAINEVPNYLDFIYIDGNHTYPFIKRDLENYYPKVREGGVFGGHDFSMHHIGVVRAVSEFVCLHRKRLDGKEFDWWIIK